MAWPVQVPVASHLVLENAAVPACLLAGDSAGSAPDGEGLARVDIALRDGRIARITAHGTQGAPPEAE